MFYFLIFITGFIAVLLFWVFVLGDKKTPDKEREIIREVRSVPEDQSQKQEIPAPAENISRPSSYASVPEQTGTDRPEPEDHAPVQKTAAKQTAASKQGQPSKASVPTAPSVQDIPIDDTFRLPYMADEILDSSGRFGLFSKTLRHAELYAESGKFATALSLYKGVKSNIRELNVRDKIDSNIKYLREYEKKALETERDYQKENLLKAREKRKPELSPEEAAEAISRRIMSEMDKKDKAREAKTQERLDSLEKDNRMLEKALTKAVDTQQDEIKKQEEKLRQQLEKEKQDEEIRNLKNQLEDLSRTIKEQKKAEESAPVPAPAKSEPDRAENTKRIEELEKRLKAHEDSFGLNRKAVQPVTESDQTPSLPQQEDIIPVTESEQAPALSEQEEIISIPESEQAPALPEQEEIISIPESEQAPALPEQEEIISIPESEQAPALPEQEEIISLPESEQAPALPEQEEIPDTEAQDSLPDSQEAEPEEDFGNLPEPSDSETPGEPTDEEIFQDIISSARPAEEPGEDDYELMKNIASGAESPDQELSDEELYEQLISDKKNSSIDDHFKIMGDSKEDRPESWLSKDQLKSYREEEEFYKNLLASGKRYKRELPILKVSYNFGKLSGSSAISRTSGMMESSFSRYSPMLEKAEELIKKRKVRDALNYYQVILDQNIPAEFKTMIRQNIRDLTAYLEQYMSGD